MKFICFGFFFLLCACGKYDVKGKAFTGLGEVRSINNVAAASPATLSAMQAICDALSVKEGALSGAVGSEYTYTTGQTNCGGTFISPPAPQQVVIQRSGENYFFLKSGGLPFIFPDVETRTSGVFKDLCNQGASLLNPVVNGSEATFISTSGFTGPDCSPVFGEETCIVLEKGQVSGASVTITTKDILRIRTGGTKGRIGFFTQRTRFSRSTCSEGEAITSTALLK